MVVQHNISAMNANRYYGINNKALAGSLEKLSSGYAINRAGDNAAGLAVSEKMRAQIGGLTQASKNAEDGISMVQTFEGALQETDSILQRMRTLAVQSANGSYQDDVDRDAIQLEFDQLNDELNQIADTDYNGTVMLNGGTMADGVHAVGNKIDYSNKRAQVTDATYRTLQSNVESAQGAYNSARTAYEDGVYDLSASGNAPEWNTVDNSRYDKDAADALWTAAGLTKTEGGTTVADTSQADSIAVTFKFDGTDWKVDSATSYLNGEEVGDVTAALQNEDTGMTVTPALGYTDGPTNVSSTAKGKGGFHVQLAGDDSVPDSLGNAVFDATKAGKGDTVTLIYKNSDTVKFAPDNIGFNETSTMNNVEDGSGTSVDMRAVIGNRTNLTDANMSESVSNALKALEDAKVEWTLDSTAQYADGDVTVNGKELSTTKGTMIRDDDGNTAYAKMTAGGVVSFYSDADCADGNKLFDLTPQKMGEDEYEAATDEGPDDETGKDPDAGTFSVKLSVSTSGFATEFGGTITTGSNPKLSTSNAAYDKMNSTKAALEDATKKLNDFRKLDSDNEADWDKIKTMYAESQSSSGNKVSISDKFDNSTATLTYTNSMDLQVGARSKDIVGFTMGYSSKGLGDLESNLNCSAREGGLETAKLSLRTSEEANAAIDKIDNAINKVNMVRATFGAVQNRLEHKINNIDTNTENLTAAESRIRDTQMDKEMMKFTSSQILSQASQSMLAQANSLPQGVLQLLG